MQIPSSKLGISIDINLLLMTANISTLSFTKDMVKNRLDIPILKFIITFEGEEQ